MPRVHSTNNLLDGVKVTGAGTALSYKNTDRSTAQVVIASTGVGTTTVNIEGTVAATSTGTYSVIDTVTYTTTTAGTSKVEDVAITSPYTFVRANVAAISTTDTAVTVNIVTQGDTY